MPATAAAVPGTWFVDPRGLVAGCTVAATSGGDRIETPWPGAPTLPLAAPAPGAIATLAAVSGGSYLDAADSVAAICRARRRRRSRAGCPAPVASDARVVVVRPVRRRARPRVVARRRRDAVPTLTPARSAGTMVRATFVKGEPMSYPRDEVKQITDRVLNMCKADAVKVRFSGGERSATRFANSSITANLIENDQEVQITVYYGKKSATATTHQFDDASLKRDDRRGAGAGAAQARQPRGDAAGGAAAAATSRSTAALPSAVDFGPAERARMVKASIDICEKKGVLGAGYIPKFDWVDAIANSAGLFAYLHYADASFILTCRTPDQTGSGWAGTTGVKDIGKQIDAAMLTEVAADKALKSAQAQGARARQLHGDHGAAAGGALPVS